MAVAFDAAVSDFGTAFTLTHSHTCTGATLAIYELSGQRFGTNGISGVTYNAVDLTKLYELDNGNLTSTFAHRLLGPATGAHNIVVSETGGSRDVATTSVSFTGVDQTTPEGVIVHATGHDTNPTLTVASAVGDIVVDAVSWYMPAAETLTVGAGQTRRSTDPLTAGPTLGFAVSTQAGAASVVMDWTASAAVYWNAVAFSVKAGGAGAGGSPLSAALQFGMGGDG